MEDDILTWNTLLAFYQKSPWVASNLQSSIFGTHYQNSFEYIFVLPFSFPLRILIMSTLRRRSCERYCHLGLFARRMELRIVQIRLSKRFPLDTHSLPVFLPPPSSMTPQTLNSSPSFPTAHRPPLLLLREIGSALLQRLNKHRNRGLFEITRVPEFLDVVGEFSCHLAKVVFVECFGSRLFLWPVIRRGIGEAMCIGMIPLMELGRFLEISSKFLAFRCRCFER